jgi:hypothetical protein
MYHFKWGDGTKQRLSSSPTATHTYTTPATRTPQLRVRDDRGAWSPWITIRIVAGNEPPVPMIDLPLETSQFGVGETVVLQGRGTDPESGELGGAKLSWTVLLHHDEHTHRLLGPLATRRTTLRAPAPESLAATETSWLQIRLTAKDPRGLTATAVRELHPRQVALTFASDPAGRELLVAGRRVTAPRTVTAWDGWSFPVEAPDQDGWTFASWSDGGAQQHTVRAPAAPQTYTATFATAP